MFPMPPLRTQGDSRVPDQAGEGSLDSLLCQNAWKGKCGSQFKGPQSIMAERRAAVRKQTEMNTSGQFLLSLFNLVQDPTPLAGHSHLNPMKRLFTGTHRYLSLS